LRIPRHIGIIPDGNRRWAISKGLGKESGYEEGLDPGLALFKLCQEKGVEEITYYGFTCDNTKRPEVQRTAFTTACVSAVKRLAIEDAALLVIGNSDSPMFPKELLDYTKRSNFNNGKTKVNFLVNYSWEWDLNHLKNAKDNKRDVLNYIKSNDISRIDLIIRWGGRRRLSGFLPVQSIYSDIYVLDEYWPDFEPEHFFRALEWYNKQDTTLGG
jgi:undecaprenyl diphosphate synthase